MNNVFGLDIGTRNVVGTVGHRTEDGAFIVEAQYVRQHETRSMLDGQIHDIGKVARTISAVKAELEAQLDAPLSEVCIAAAGRVLKTVTTHVEYEYAEESVVTGEDIHTLNLLGVEQAQDILREQNDTKYKFYCVGYSVVKYYLNEEVFISIEGHKANKIGEDIIVTFLPEDVVDGLYSAVGQAKMTVANMTLEPIAAINVAIPENFRMLNIALVDVGAGTSDISITREGSIIAYGMIPYAGDELTELIVQQYLVDFQTAEKMKLASSSEDEVTYEDIMSISHTIPSKEIWELVAPTVEKITSEVAAKIKELLETNAFNSSIYIAVDTLEFLKRGGRLTAAGAALGSVLNIKPVLTIQGERLDAFAKVRGMKKAKLRMIEALKNDFETRFQGIPKERLRLGAAGAGLSAEQEKEWTDMLSASFPEMDVYYDSLSFSISCHIGPGGYGVGISVIGEYDL